jgi:hypothetical protein
MKRAVWFCVAGVAFAATILLVSQMQTTPSPGPAALMPDGALLYLEARDFRSLLNGWNSSEEKRAWLAGDNYAAFSHSRLFERLSQAQDEFSTTASVSADSNLLMHVAGSQSALALYDIGNLQFVYVTRMDEAQAEASPLWQVREKFEQRQETEDQFFVREDQQLNRTAAFAIHKGWLILGTRADLVAGVLDRLDGQVANSLPDESWYADSVKQAARIPGDLRMVLNLEKIVPSPYFRSYWVQRNITEMKQYRAAICDLEARDQEYRESRWLLRAPGSTAQASGDVEPLLAVVPLDASFASAQASPDIDSVIASLREGVLDPRLQQAAGGAAAPPAVQIENAGTASDLEQRIDVAPIRTNETDPYSELRQLLQSSDLIGMLQVYRTESSPSSIFVTIDRGAVLQSNSVWNEIAVQNALSATLRHGLTASQLGINWSSRAIESGSAWKLDGSIPLLLAVRKSRLYLANSESLLGAMLSRGKGEEASANDGGITYEADLRHDEKEQQAFINLAARLDDVGRGTPSAGNADADTGSDGQAPPFFSGSIQSLNRMWSRVVREKVTDKDLGAVVSQKVVYEWQQH